MKNGESSSNDAPESNARIVETPDVLGGRPRVAGTRIGVQHIWASYERGDTAADIAEHVYPSVSEADAAAAIEWAQDHPDRVTAIRRENDELHLQHAILQSAVDAAVMQCNEQLRTLLDARSAENSNDHRPVASLLRNGFQNADGLEISVDTATNRVVIEVDEKVVARFQAH